MWSFTTLAVATWRMRARGVSCNEPGVLDEITCSVDSGSEVALQVDLYFGGCVYHPSVHSFFDTYNDEMLVQLLGRMTQR